MKMNYQNGSTWLTTRGFSLAAIFMAIAAFFGFGTHAVNNMQATTTVNASAQTSATSDWKTYTDPKHGLSFMYPSGFTVYESKQVKEGASRFIVSTSSAPLDLVNGCSNDYINVYAYDQGSIISNSVDKTTGDYLNRVKMSAENDGDVVVSDTTSTNQRVLMTKITKGTTAFPDVWVANGKYIVQISAVKCSTSTDIFTTLEKMSSTFKLTSNSESASSNSTNPNMSGGLNVDDDVVRTKANDYADADFGVTLVYPYGWHLLKQGNVITIDTQDPDLRTIKITEILSTTVDDSTGKWGKYILHATANGWSVTQSSERDGSLNDVPTVPIASTATGEPIFKGGYMSHGWGQFDYIVAIKSNKFLLVSGGESVDKPYDPNNDKLLNFVRTITTN